MSSSALTSPQWRVMDAVPDGIIVVDEEGTITFCNDAAESIFKWEAEALIGESIESLLPHEYRSRHRGLRSDYTDDPKRRPMDAGVEVQARRRDGSTFPAEVSLNPVDTSEGRRIVAAVRDTSRRRALEDALQMRESRYRSLFRNARDAVYVSTAGGEIRDMNPSGLELFGYPREEMLGMTAEQLYADPEDRQRFREAVDREDGVSDFPVRLRRRDGTEFHAEITASVERGGDGEPILFQGILRDVTDEYRDRERLKHEATHDWLTELPNRSKFRERLRAVLERSRANGERVALLFIDLDDFKTINDEMGHRVGDEVLQICAGRLRGAVRRDDLVARFGGDEFIVLLEAIEGASAARQTAQRIARGFDEPLEVDGDTLQLTASVGMAVIPDPRSRTQEGGPVTPEQLIETADRMMYEAKQRSAEASNVAVASELDGASSGPADPSVEEL